MKCRHCGQDMPEPGVALTPAERKVWEVLFHTSQPLSNEELRLLIYTAKSRTSSLLRTHIAHIREKLRKTKWRITREPYQVILAPFL